MGSTGTCPMSNLLSPCCRLARIHVKPKDGNTTTMDGGLVAGAEPPWHFHPPQAFVQ